MIKIKATPINEHDFAPFGTFCNMEEPEGYALEGELHRFYPDRMSESCTGRLAFSPMTVKKPDRMIVTQVERHTTTPEMLLPLNDDMIIHVSPASGDTPVTSLTKAFLVKKGTMVKINTAIWHLAPLPCKSDLLKVIVILPECTYANDCKVVELKEDQQFEIE